MTKFINVFLITISITIFLALAALGIAYLVEPSLVKDWIGIEQVEQIEPETPVDPETPEEPEEPTDPEEPEEIVYVTNVADYEFDGDTITAYNGDDGNILLPTSYSIAGTENVELTFNEQNELLDYVIELMNTSYPFPLIVTDNENQVYVFNSEMDIIENFTIVYPVKMEVEKTIYTEGNDYQVTKIGSYAFAYLSSLISIKIPDSVTGIGSSAFMNCSSLISVTIPNSITSISNSVFRYCSSLTSITIPDSITSIGSFAFSDCNSLTSIIIPNSVTIIHDWAFSSCTSLTSITIGKGVTNIIEYAFNNCAALVEIFNYSGLTINIGETSYSNNSYLGQYAKVVHNLSDGEIKPETMIIVLDNIQYYEYGDDFVALAPSVSKPSLTTVTLDSRTTEINRYAFYNCENLTSITIPDGVTSIGNYAFFECTNLTSITISEGVKTIGDYAFYRCNSLTSMRIEAATPPTITDNTIFSATTQIYVPSTSVEAYKTAWSDYADLIKSIDELEVA